MSCAQQCVDGSPRIRPESRCASRRRSRLLAISIVILERPPVDRQKPVGSLRTCVTWVQFHRLEAVMLLQHSTSPLPNTAQIRLPAELIALLGHRDWVPVLEPHIGPLKVNEEIAWLETRRCAGVAVGQMV